MSEQRSSTANFTKRASLSSVVVVGDCKSKSDVTCVHKMRLQLFGMKIFMTPTLIAALGVGLALMRLAGHASAETASASEGFYAPETIEWKPGPPSVPTGAKMAVLEGDPTKEGPFVMRLQAPAGYHIAPHTHTKTERVTVISGTMLLAMGENLDRSAAKTLNAGTYAFWPAGMKHTAWFDGTTIIQLHGIGPWKINYVNPADDPRNVKKSP